MKLIYKDVEYECISAEKERNHIIIRTGKVEDNEELIYHIYGDIDFDAVCVVDGELQEQPGTEDILDVLLGVKS